MGLRPYAAWPGYFAEYGRREPRAKTHTPTSFAWGKPELPVWDIMGANPEHKAVFAAAMKAQTMLSNAEIVGPKAMYSIDWLADEAAKTTDSGKPLLVDVGGGLGQMLKGILAVLPNFPRSRLVLQDRQEVIKEAEQIADPALEGVVHMGHDFHQEQPVKGE